MGFAYIFACVFFLGVRAAILNPKRHYTRRVKLDFGGLSFLGLRLYSSISERQAKPVQNGAAMLVLCVSLHVTCTETGT